MKSLIELNIPPPKNSVASTKVNEIMIYCRSNADLGVGGEKINQFQLSFTKKTLGKNEKKRAKNDTD